MSDNVFSIGEAIDQEIRNYLLRCGCEFAGIGGDGIRYWRLPSGKLRTEDEAFAAMGVPPGAIP